MSMASGERGMSNINVSLAYDKRKKVAKVSTTVLFKLLFFLVNLRNSLFNDFHNQTTSLKLRECSSMHNQVIPIKTKGVIVDMFCK